MEDREYLTPREVANRLRLSLRSVYRLLAEGKIAGVRRGERGCWLITPAAADAYLTSPRGPAPVPTAEGQRMHEAAMERLKAMGYRTGA